MLKGCWDALVTRLANCSAQGVTLLQARLSVLKFVDDGPAPISEFFAKFEGLVLDLRCAAHPLTDAEICAKLVLAMPLSLQPLVSSLWEGSNGKTLPTGMPRSQTPGNG